MTLTRTIKLDTGVTVEVLDIGVDDLAKASSNRRRIKDKISTEWWRQMEDARDSSNSRYDLPLWVPVAWNRDNYGN